MGGEVVFLNAELLDDVGVGKDAAEVTIAAGVHAAIEGVGDAVAAGAVDDEGVAFSGAGAVGDDPGLDGEPLGDVAAIEREADNALFFDEAFEGTGLGFEQGRGGGDGGVRDGGAAGGRGVGEGGVGGIRMREARVSSRVGLEGVI